MRIEAKAPVRMQAKRRHLKPCPLPLTRHINQQRTILAAVEYLDLDSATKIVKDSETPTITFLLFTADQGASRSGALGEGVTIHP